MQTPADNDKPMTEEEFSTLLREIVPALRGYVMSLIPHHATCEDVIQEAHLFLWEKRADFQRGTSFKAWAFKVAYFKAMAQRRNHAREQKRITFSEETILRIAAKSEEVSDQAQDRMDQLKLCLGQLKPEEKELLRYKYLEQGSLTELAQTTGRTANTIHKAISRLRLRLKACIDKQTFLSK